MNAGVALGGVAAGLIASVGHPGSFTVLFVIDCVTFIGYMLVLARVRSPELHEERLGGSWRAVARDHVFTAFTALNAVFMAAAISLMVELLPAFAKNVTHVNERQVGIIFALDAVGVTLFQATPAFALLAAAMLVFAVGECLHRAIHAPLSVDLAPPQMLGGYVAAASLSWQIGWIVGPAGGGFLLQHAPLCSGRSPRRSTWPARRARSRSSHACRRPCA